MKIRRLINTISAAGTALLAAAVFTVNGAAPVSASNRDSFNPLSDHTGEEGAYLYHFEGRLTNPCSSSARGKKPSVVNSFYIDFRLTDDNGTGESFTKRLDMSYAGWGNNNSEFFERNFVRGNDDETGLSFDLWLPGHLTGVDMHLELDGYIGWFNYERMSFRIDSISCGGIQVNKSSDNVNSSTGSSDGHMSVVMEKPTGRQLTGITHDGELTETAYKKMIDDGTLGNDVKDKYGSRLTLNAVKNMLSDPDNAVNQWFSHSDETGMYLYTLNMKVDNPIDMDSAADDAVETFVMDFTYNGSEHYRLDMSRDGSRNRNERYVDIFRSSNDDSYYAKMDIWLPGKINKVNVLLNMSGGERLRIEFADVLINGFKVNKVSDHVTSSYYDSNAEIDCIMPDSQIDLRDFDETEMKSVLDMIFSGEQDNAIPLRDQYGSAVGKQQISSAHDEMMSYINASGVSVSTGYRYADVVKGFAMYKTVYCANSLDILQKYVEDKCAEHLSSDP